MIYPWLHGNYPCGSWGINRQADAEWHIDFGRNVRADLLILTTRADFPHDSSWTEASVRFSDGTDIVLKLLKTGDGQCFPLHGRIFSGFTLHALKKADDASPFPALVQVEVTGTNA